MAIPRFSDLKKWVGKLLKNTEWDFNFQKIVDWLTDGSADLTVGNFDCTNFTSDTATVAGGVTAASFTGDGSGLTGLGANANHYLLYVRTLSLPTPHACHTIVQKAATLNQISYFLKADAGLQIDAMDSTAGWLVRNADSSGITTDLQNYYEGAGCVTFNKGGTSSNVGGMYKAISPTFSPSGTVFRAAVKLGSTNSVSAVRLELGSSSANYRYWDLTGDVNGDAPTTKWQIYSVYADSGDYTGSAGTYPTNNITYASVGILLGSAGITHNGCAVDHLVAVPGATTATPTLQFNVRKNELLIGQGTATTTFTGVKAGKIFAVTANLTNTTLAAGDIISLDLTTGGSYGGEGLAVLCETI